MPISMSICIYKSINAGYTYKTNIHAAGVIFHQDCTGISIWEEQDPESFFAAGWYTIPCDWSIHQSTIINQPFHANLWNFYGSGE